MAEVGRDFWESPGPAVQVKGPQGSVEYPQRWKSHSCFGPCSSIWLPSCWKHSSLPYNQNFPSVTCACCWSIAEPPWVFQGEPAPSQLSGPGSSVLFFLWERSPKLKPILVHSGFLPSCAVQVTTFLSSSSCWSRAGFLKWIQSAASSLAAAGQTTSAGLAEIWVPFSSSGHGNRQETFFFF